MSYWVLQANAKLFRIEEALKELDTILWRVPQYTDQVAPGDHVLLWRSGSKAGVVGIGTVQSVPHLVAVPDGGLRFTDIEGGEGMTETRVLVSVHPVSHVSKVTFVDDELLSTPQIIRAPMGTVFPVTQDEWAAAMALLSNPTLPELEAVEVGDAKTAINFSWKGRKKAIGPCLVNVRDSRLCSRQGWTSWESDIRKSDDVVRLARRGDIKYSQLTIDFGVSEASIYNWVKPADIDDGVRGV